MFQSLIRPLYHSVHEGLNQIFPLLNTQYHGKKILKGHVSDEHLANPALDEHLAADLSAIGVHVETYQIDVAGYQDYLKEANYPTSYYGGGLDPAQNFTEKTLEHYVSLDFLNLSADARFIDIAACTSPFYQILRKRYPGIQTYQQDLIFQRGLHEDKIGGYASELYLPDGSVDAVSLHCSLEHFEADSDTEFFQELERVLTPGGRAVILPFYLAHEYSIHVDPAFNLLKRHKPQLDPKARLRYCDWYQYFSRHYDPAALKRRILDQVPSLQLRVYRVENFRALDSEGYMRLIGVFEKR